jgi:hypothetical protein
MTRQASLGVVLLFLLIGIGIFGRTVSFGFQSFDDDLLITNNPIVLNPTLESLKAAFTSYDPELYVPLTTLSYQVTVVLAGLNAGIFHLINVFLHIATSLLVVWFLLILTQKKPLALVAGLLFLIHPVNVEAVAWIAGRKDVLAGFFAVASLVAYTSHARSGDRQKFIVSLLLFLLAVLSKPSVLPLPAVFVLIDLILERRTFPRSVVAQRPSFFIAVVFGLVAIYGKKAAGGSGLGEALLLSGQAILLTISHLVVPIRLSVMYPFSGSVTVLNPAILLSIVTVGIALICLFLVRRRSPWTVFHLASALILFVPGLFNAHKTGGPYITSDRYIYLPLIFLAAAAAAGWDSVMIRFRVSSGYRTVFIASLFSLLILLSFARVAVWKDGVTLFTDALRRTPDSVIALNNRSNAHAKRGDTDAAIADLRRATEVAPEMPAVHRNLATLLSNTGHMNEAFQEAETALRLHPRSGETYYLIGRLLQKRGDEARSKDAFKNAYLLDPAFVLKQLDVATIERR